MIIRRLARINTPPEVGRVRSRLSDGTSTALFSTEVINQPDVALRCDVTKREISSVGRGNGILDEEASPVQYPRAAAQRNVQQSEAGGRIACRKRRLTIGSPGHIL